MSTSMVQADCPSCRASLRVPAEWLGVSRPGDPTLRIERVVCDGPPAEAIIALAEKLGCELIVLGAQGYDRLLTGPVAQEVLRRASCPVLCLPTSSPAPTSTSTSASTLADGVFATPSPTDLSAFFAAE